MFMKQSFKQVVEVDNIYLQKQATAIANDTVAQKPKPQDPSPLLYFLVFGTWIAAILWFGPRLFMLMNMTDTLVSKMVMGLFIFFINFAWLYGIYNFCVVVFAWFYSLKKREPLKRKHMLEFPQTAILYTTCNDFVEESVLSCVKQDYPNYKVYILDDSRDETYKAKIDDFASRYPDLVQVVRRADRVGFKAGNMNNALSKVVKEKYFAIADADEILPTNFLSLLVPVMEADATCGFVQANHRANPNTESQLGRDMGIGIDLHWKWYQPLRNDYGFVMFLGHGALLRRKTWEEIGGFPDIVSEDLGFAIHAREQGYRGYFAEDVICYEDFPDTVRSFRVRHMKWTRGTSEFLHSRFKWLIKARNITWQEKFDILFPTLNLPLTMFYFLFMINANIFLPLIFGHWRDMTIEMAGTAFVMPILQLDKGFEVIYDFDFYLITMLTFFSPVLCFIVGMFLSPVKMVRFISQSTSLYAALTPISTLGVLAYMVTGKAIFLVTGGNNEEEIADNKANTWRSKLSNSWHTFLTKSHPDHWMVQGFEIMVAIFFGVAAIFMFQISFLGLCLAFAILPLMHKLGWEHKVSKVLRHVPFVLIIAGILLSSLSLLGMQYMFFGYGFHF